MRRGFLVFLQLFHAWRYSAVIPILGFLLQATENCNLLVSILERQTQDQYSLYASFPPKTMNQINRVRASSRKLPSILRWGELP